MLKKRAIIITISCLMVIGMLIPAIAWFAKYVKAEFPEVTGSTAVSYFESGDGSAENPYIISSPVHMYNLAWLQYIGYFNLNPDVNNGRAQNYFQLKNDIDMTGVELPPIGTTEYPFLGNFDGNGKVLSNLTTSNSDTVITKKPSAAKFNNHLLTQYNGEVKEAGAIIGFFGVVGDYNGAIAAVQSQITADTPYPDFDANAIAVQNTGLASYKVDDDSMATTVGLVAGYVNAPISNMLVGDATLQVQPNAKVSNVGTANISDHTLIGYCTEAYKNTLQDCNVKVYDPTVTVEDPHVIQNTSGGENQGWGGSIAMTELYENLVKARGEVDLSTYTYREDKVLSATGENLGVTSETSPYFFVNTKDNGQFSAVFTRATANGNDTTQYLYVSGGKKVNTVTNSYGAETDAYIISYNGTYLNATSGTSPDVTDGTNSAGASKWILSSEGYLYTDIGGVAYYLNSEDNSSVTLSTTPETEWTKNDDSLTYTAGYNSSYKLCYDGGWKVGDEDSNFYYIHSGNNYLSANGTSGITNKTTLADATLWEFSGDKSGRISTTVNGQTYYLRYDDGLTLNRWSPTSWSNSNNKLYYSSGGWSSTTRYIRLNNSTWTTSSNSGNATTLTFTPVESSLTFQETKSAQLVVSENLTMEFDETNSTYIPLQMDATNYTVKDNNTGYITSGTWDETVASGHTYPVRSGDIRVSRYKANSISDRNNVYIHNGTSFETLSLTSDGKDVGLEKFADCKQDYIDMLNDSDGNLDGLHFMNGLISKDVLVNIPKAVINGDEYTNYKVPADCIDFQLKEKGYINFFAGTYFSGNNCFFSLHEIIRDGQEIKEIKEIEKICKKTGATEKEPYLYLYDANEAAPTGYEVIFDMNWLKNAFSYDGFDDNRGYYFEVPVNPGEYALGSVEGGTGAYLVYLDISANAQLMDRTVTTEMMTESENTYIYANGVGVMQGATYEIDDTEHVSVTLKEGFSGDIIVSKTDDIVMVNTANANLTVGAAGGVSVVDGKQQTLTPVPISSKTVTTKRVTYDEVNRNTGAKSQYTITCVQDDSGGEMKVTVVDGAGTDVTATVVDRTENGITYLNTTKKDDQINWSTINPSSVVLEYTYQTTGEDVTVTNTTKYLSAEKKYEVTVVSTQGMTITVRQVNTTDDVSQSTINGASVVKNQEISVEATGNES